MKRGRSPSGILLQPLAYFDITSDRRWHVVATGNLHRFGKVKYVFLLRLCWMPFCYLLTTCKVTLPLWSRFFYAASTQSWQELDWNLFRDGAFQRENYLVLVPFFVYINEWSLMNTIRIIHLYDSPPWHNCSQWENDLLPRHSMKGSPIDVCNYRKNDIDNHVNDLFLYSTILFFRDAHWCFQRNALIGLLNLTAALLLFNRFFVSVRFCCSLGVFTVDSKIVFMSSTIDRAAHRRATKAAASSSAKRHCLVFFPLEASHGIWPEDLIRSRGRFGFEAKYGKDWFECRIWKEGLFSLFLFCVSLIASRHTGRVPICPTTHGEVKQWEREAMVIGWNRSIGQRWW